VKFTQGRWFVHNPKRGCMKVSNTMEEIVQGEWAGVATSCNFLINVVTDDLRAGVSREVVGVYGGCGESQLYANVETMDKACKEIVEIW
jgi:hypothetical protein